ncbi:MAG: hypothetical protein WCS30_12910, partial [Selenomonadaceae bacterium]
WANSDEIAHLPTKSHLKVSLKHVLSIAISPGRKFSAVRSTADMCAKYKNMNVYFTCLFDKTLTAFIIT